MNLVNFPKVRIQKYDEGFCVEIEQISFWGKKTWVHIISVFGFSDLPWYYKTYDMALNEAKKLFGWDLIENSESHD